MAARAYRGGAFSLAELLPLRTLATAQVVAGVRPSDRLEELERELAALLAIAAPATWRAHRRPITRVLRAARRELRARDRRHFPGDVA